MLKISGALNRMIEEPVFCKINYIPKLKITFSLYLLYQIFPVYYIDDIERDVCCPNNEPELIKETISTALVDAKNCLGATSSHYAMDIAIQKAKCSGAGWVAVKGVYLESCRIKE